MTSSPVLATLKLKHEKVRISVKDRLMSKISSYDYNYNYNSNSTWPRVIKCEATELRVEERS